MERHLGTCTLCAKGDLIRNINIYPFGSEGVDACYVCEMKIVEFARNLRLEAGKKRKEEFIQSRNTAVKGGPG